MARTHTGRHTSAFSAEEASSRSLRNNPARRRETTQNRHPTGSARSREILALDPARHDSGPDQRYRPSSSAPPPPRGGSRNEGILQGWVAAALSRPTLQCSMRIDATLGIAPSAVRLDGSRSPSRDEPLRLAIRAAGVVSLLVCGPFKGRGSTKVG